MRQRHLKYTEIWLLQSNQFSPVQLFKNDEQRFAPLLVNDWLMVLIFRVTFRSRCRLVSRFLIRYWCFCRLWIRLYAFDTNILNDFIKKIKRFWKCRSRIFWRKKKLLLKCCWKSFEKKIYGSDFSMMRLKLGFQ